MLQTVVARRNLIAMIAAAAMAWPISVPAQQIKAIHHIGCLYPASSEAMRPFVLALRDALSELGYVEGKNIALDIHYADGRYDQLPGLARAMLDAKPELIVTSGGPPTIAAVKSISPKVPVVFITSDPVAEGIVESLSRPGGNFTGVAILATNLDPKRMEMAKEAFPAATKIAVLRNPAFPSAEAQERAILAAAARLAVKASIVSARNADELELAFAEIAKLQPDFLFVATDAVFYQEMTRIISFAAAHAIPAIYQQRQFVDAGGLMAYGANLVEAQRQLAPYIDKILRGVRPTDLPVELPRTFDLSVNLKAAKAIGIVIPESLLLHADEVIE